MELKNKYFHSVHSYIYSDNMYITDRKKELEDILYKFDCILKSGYILPYKDIYELYGEGKINRNRYARFNKRDMVSISLHEDSPEEFDLKYKEDCDGDYEDAFQSFVFQEPSIVLNERIMTELRHNKYPMIYLERLFLEPISLKYMDAISVKPGRLLPFFEEVPRDKYEYYATLEQYIRYINLKFLDDLRDLLDKYGYNVPFVSLLTGNEYHENMEYRKLLENKYSVK